MSDEEAPSSLDDLWDFGDPAASEARFRAAVAEARAGEGPAPLAEALTQLGRSQGLQRRFDEARATLAQAEDAVAPGDERSRVRLLLERGRVANSARAGDRGRADFVAAWELALSAREDALAVDAAHMLGIVEPPVEAAAWNERALGLARESPDPAAQRWIASIANNMGWAAHDAGELDAALDLFQLALAERLRQGDVARIRIARWCVARCLRSLGRVEEALGMQRALLAELDAAAATDGYVPEEIGECLLELGRGAEARPYFALAYAQLSADAWLRDSEPDRLARLAALGSGEPPGRSGHAY